MLNTHQMPALDFQALSLSWNRHKIISVITFACFPFYFNSSNEMEQTLTTKLRAASLMLFLLDLENFHLLLL